MKVSTQMLKLVVTNKQYGFINVTKACMLMNRYLGLLILGYRGLTTWLRFVRKMI